MNSINRKVLKPLKISLMRFTRMLLSVISAENILSGVVHGLGFGPRLSVIAKCQL